MKTACFTIASYPPDQFDSVLAPLKQSAAKHGVPLQVFSPEKLTNSMWELKVEFMLEVLRKLSKDYTHAVYTDAADVLFLDDWDNMVMPADCEFGTLYGAEANCYPYPFLADNYPTTKSRYRFINAGTFVCKIGKAIQQYEQLLRLQIPQSKFACDQTALTLAFLCHYICIDIDTHCQFSMCLNRGGYRVEGKRIVCEQWGTRPPIVHFNGPAKHGQHELKASLL